MPKIFNLLLSGLLLVLSPSLGFADPVAATASEKPGTDTDVTAPHQDEPEAGGLTQVEIMGVIRAGLPMIRNCYVKRLKAKKQLSGQLKTFWIINANGTVDTAEVVESTVKDTRLASCVVKVIQGWKFPKPRGTEPVSVNYPFIFNPE
jgi:TonB family protein